MWSYTAWLVIGAMVLALHKTDINGDCELYVMFRLILYVAGFISCSILFSECLWPLISWCRRLLISHASKFNIRLILDQSWMNFEDLPLRNFIVLIASFHFSCHHNTKMESLLVINVPCSWRNWWLLFCKTPIFYKTV